MAIGGLGVSLAGFAGLIAALDRRPTAHSPIASWRIRNIVIGGFITTFAGFGTVALFTATDEDLTLTVRLAGIFLAGAVVVRAWFEQRPGPAWPNDRGRWFAIGSVIVLVALAIANGVRARLGLLQFMFLYQLADPVSIFFNTVRDVTRGDDEAHSA